MSLDPVILQAVQVAARFGFISDRLFWDCICTSKRAMAYRQWKKIKSSIYFASIESNIGLNSYLKLSRIGRNLAVDLSIVPIHAPFLQQLAHDELLVRFALSSEKDQLIKKAFPEAYLKSSPYEFTNSFTGSNRKIPDLYFALNVADKKIRVAMEFERTRKAQSRYRSMLMSYVAFKDAELVLFIVNDESTEKMIRGTAQKIKYPLNTRPLAFATAEDVQKNPSRFAMRLQNRTIEFHKFVQELRDLKERAA